MNPSFNLQTPEIYTESAELFAEAGPSGISLVILNTGKYFQAVVTYSFSNKLNEWELTEKLKEILQNDELLQKPYKKIHIIWSYPESILVPPELMNSDNNNGMLNLVYGDSKKGGIKTDFLYKHNLHNIYRIPVEIQECFAAKFPYATQTHQYSLLVNRDMQNGFNLFTVFYPNSLTVMLFKAGKLQIIQNFAYTYPEDSAYHLLNICKNYYVFPSTVKLHISGMIDEKSNLYAAIHKYFFNIQFTRLPGSFTYSEEIKNYPEHFFSHLFFMASCV